MIMTLEFEDKQMISRRDQHSGMVRSFQMLQGQSPEEVKMLKTINKLNGKSQCPHSIPPRIATTLLSHFIPSTLE